MSAITTILRKKGLNTAQIQGLIAEVQNRTQYNSSISAQELTEKLGLEPEYITDIMNYIID